MKLADSGRSRSPEEGLSFIEQYVLPTLEICKKLEEEKKIVAGGPVGGAIALWPAGKDAVHGHVERRAEVKRNVGS